MFCFSQDAAIFLGVYKEIRSDAGWGLVTFWFAWLIILVILLEVNGNFCKSNAYESIDEISRHIQNNSNSRIQVRVI